MELITKIAVFGLLFLGEAISIYAEMVGARGNTVMSQPFLQVFIKSFIFITVAGGCLVAGYMLGLKSFKNIWLCSVISITSILIIEPLMAIFLLKQLPTIGTGAGFVLGIIGLYLSVFF